MSPSPIRDDNRGYKYTRLDFERFVKDNAERNQPSKITKIWSSVCNTISSMRSRFRGILTRKFGSHDYYRVHYSRDRDRVFLLKNKKQPSKLRSVMSSVWAWFKNGINSTASKISRSVTSILKCCRKTPVNEAPDIEQDEVQIVLLQMVSSSHEDISIPVGINICYKIVIACADKFKEIDQVGYPKIDTENLIKEYHKSCETCMQAGDKDVDLSLALFTFLIAIQAYQKVHDGASSSDLNILQLIDMAKLKDSAVASAAEALNGLLNTADRVDQHSVAQYLLASAEAQLIEIGKIKENDVKEVDATTGNGEKTIMLEEYFHKVSEIAAYSDKWPILDDMFISNLMGSIPIY